MYHTDHTNAVVNVCCDDEDCIGKEKIQLKDSKAHCKDTDDDGKQRDE